MRRTAALRKKWSNSVQAGWSFSLVKDDVDSANEAPSSDVKQSALEFAPSEITWVTPSGAMLSSPPVVLHMSTGTLTFFDGRNPTGRTKATLLVLLGSVEIAPLKCTIPEISAIAGVAEPNGAVPQPLSSVSFVYLT